MFGITKKLDEVVHSSKSRHPQHLYIASTPTTSQQVGTTNFKAQP